MKINTIKIKNFRGIPDMEIFLERISFFTGPCGAGKTSVLKAFNFALTGDVKKDDIREQSDRASATIVFEDQSSIQRICKLSAATQVKVNGKNSTAKAADEFLQAKLGTSTDIFQAMCKTDFFEVLSQKEQTEFFLSILPTKISFEKLCEFIGENNKKLTEEEKTTLKTAFANIPDPFGLDEIDMAYKYFYQKRKLINGYQEYKEELHLIDFDDMLQKAYEIMVNDKECLDFLRNKYRYIQVDEYQDTNLIQKDIIYLLAGQDGNLAVVGDDDQSIYAFRGAKPEIMLNFQKEYPKSKMVKMSTNYRSGKKIISEADRVIKSNTNRFQKDFIGFKPENGAVEYIVTEEKKDEILKVFSRIKKLLNDGENPADIAVLFRTNRQAEKMAAILFRNQIPFQSNEKIQSKYEHWMFQDLQAYYRLANKHLDNKSSDARRDLSRVLNHPNRYLFGYIIFLCKFDPFGLARIKYTFMQTCQEDYRIKLGDDAYIIYINPFGMKENPTEDMIALMSYLRGEMIKRNSFIEDLDAAVKRAREKEDWKVEYMALSLKFQDAMEEGRAEGRAEMQRNIVIKLLSANQFSDKEICSIVDISEEKLEEYKKMYMD